MDHVKKYRWFSSFIISLFLLHFFNLSVFANSSWIWISETRPLDIMPWVAVGTLILETVSLMVFAKIKNGYKTFAVVTIANAVSFAAPYLLGCF